MIRRALLLFAILAAKAFAWDRILARRRGMAPPAPLRMLVVIDAPIETVWRVVADVPLQVEWMSEMRSLTMTPPGPVRAGTRGVASLRIFGVPMNDPVEVVEVEAPRRYAVRHEGLFKGGGLITLEPGADGSTTIVRWEETLVPPLLPELGALLQAPILRWIFQEDLNRLRRLVETGSADE
jgi:uncharacterized protein YndB with AHSA1/START domain